MANIRENKKRKNGVLSLHGLLGTGRTGKAICRYTTWTQPDGLTPAKAKKAAERAADTWEQEVKA